MTQLNEIKFRISMNAYTQIQRMREILSYASVFATMDDVRISSLPLKVQLILLAVVVSIISLKTLVFICTIGRGLYTILGIYFMAGLLVNLKH
jgi:hypothetical protein